MIELNACCFCFSLRTGSLIIGYLSLVSFIVLAILDCISLTTFITRLYNGYINAGTGYVVIGILSFLIFLILIFIAYTIVFLVGLHKERPGHVKAYLKFGLNVLVFSVGISVYIAFNPNISLGIRGIGGSVWIILSVQIYCLLVIRSHYKKMKEQDLNPI